MQTDLALKAKFESLFGTDSAIGVMCEVVKNESVELMSLQDFALKYGHITQDMYSDFDYSTVMPDGTSATCCTNYAHHVRKMLEPIGYSVDIIGFANEDNPESKCAKEAFHPGGHDFALVSGRFLVDPWVRLVACIEDQIVYDLNSHVDAAKVLDIYGPQNCWKRFDGQRFSPFTHQP